MKPILSKSALGVHPGKRPPAAVEIAPQGVLAASLPSGGQTPVFAWQALAEDVLLPGLNEPNIHDAEALAAALRSALSQTSPQTRNVTLILPDRAVRVFLLDFESLPPHHDEALSVLRFRLRKMVPFDVEQAGISYQILSQTKDETRVLAAVIPAPVRTEYEAATRAAGYEPGAVLPSGLAALAGIVTLESALVANLSTHTLTVMITNGNDLLLYRSVELPLDPAQHAPEVQRCIAVASAFFEDKLGARPSRVLYAGVLPLQEFSVWINNPELPVTELAKRPETGFVTTTSLLSTASVTGALAGTR